LGPAENAWRRSSNWPFVVQIIMALLKPADYASKMFDTSRLKLNNAGQYTYGDYNEFLSPASLNIHGDVIDGNIVRTAGYSVFLVEIGKKKNSSFISQLKQDLQNGNFNLMVKLGGFASKDKLSISIDSFQLTTQNPTLYIPNENYSIHFNVSTPIKSIPLSGIIIIKKQSKFIIKGYDKKDLYFKIYQPLHSVINNSISVGQIDSTFVYWSENQLYTASQIVFYQSSYYTVISDHNSLTAFDKKYYKALTKLPSVKGVSILSPSGYDNVETIIPYGTELASLQDVADVILGYGHWLQEQGFIFDNYSTDFSQTINWEFTVKEFLYWSTQNWADNSVITLSPFADTIKFSFKQGVVDNVLDSFYEYSILRADGLSFPSVNFYTARQGNEFVISTKNTQEGFFFIRLVLVQKEHCLIFDNKTIFNDTIYAIDTGYKQQRVKVKGFRTSSWNGDYFSPGFIYDKASIQLWSSYQAYLPGDIVEYVGRYYSSNQKITGSENFDAINWTLLDNKPISALIPNFDYKINQFEDFYSLDIDNFDISQQKLAQHLIGYSPRSYLDNIFSNPISQYKFYQGYIKEKGTKNALTKLEKASTANLQGTLEFNEEWAFRVGYFGSYSSYNEIELPLRETAFVENSQLIQFVDELPESVNPLISYITPKDLAIKPDEYISSNSFSSVSGTLNENNLILPTAGYVRLDDVTYTLVNIDDLLTITDTSVFAEGDKIWVGFDKKGTWNVYRYTRQLRYVISVSLGADLTLTFSTNLAHGLQVGEIISIRGMDPGLNKVYIIKSIPSPSTFIVDTIITSLQPTTPLGLIFTFKNVRFNHVDDLSDFERYFIQELHKNDNSSGEFLHTVIYGPPGTGKTEIAKIMGKIYSKIGILSKGTFTKVTRSDLVAGYLGQTALKTKDVIKEALGGVLFIDEAYSLANGDREDSYSKECLDTLCEALSDHKNDLMVIIAGYEDELNDTFFRVNKGLESRFIWRFTMEEYSSKELMEIFKKKISEIDWSLEDLDEKKLQKWFDDNKTNFKHFGRDMELLLTYVKIAHGRRIYMRNKELRKIISMDDIKNGYDVFIKNKKTKKEPIFMNSIYI
jgi:hypothetical protein